jgi:hypothetical protein
MHQSPPAGDSTTAPAVSRAGLSLHLCWEQESRRPEQTVGFMPGQGLSKAAVTARCCLLSTREFVSVDLPVFQPE